MRGGARRCPHGVLLFSLFLLTVLSSFLPLPPGACAAAGSVKEGRHFLVRFKGPENRDAGHLVGLVLEEAYVKVGADFAYWPEKRVEAVLYSDREFYDITRSPSWVSALYDGRIKLPVKGVRGRVDRLVRVIYHEYTHVVVRELSGARAPLWLDEGLAMYEEGRRPSLDRAALRDLSEGVTLRDLALGFRSSDRKEVERAYILSYSAVDYIVGEFGFSAVKRVLAALKEGLDTDAAFRAAMYLSLDDIEALWKGRLSR